MNASHALLLVAASIPLAVGAAELPKRKSGLWEIGTAVPGNPAGPNALLCVDASTDDLTRQLAGVGIPCSKNKIRREAADRYVIDSVCMIGESTATSRSVLTGDFARGYRIDIHAKYKPPLMNMNEGRSTLTARWTGPCKPGQQAGDLVLPSGVTINVLTEPRAPTK